MVNLEVEFASLALFSSFIVIIFFGTLCVERLSGISNYMMSKCSLKHKMPPFKVSIAVFVVSSGLTYKRSDSVNSALY